MPFERIESADDPRIALYKRVGDPELLRAHNLFIAEGRLVVQRLIEDGRYALRSILLNGAARRSLDGVLQEVVDRVPVYVCDTTNFIGLTGFNLHRGCLALVGRPEPPEISSVLSSAHRVIALDGVGNPDNVGGVFRNAAAFGVDGVLIGPTTCDPLYRKAIRTSMGATLRVPFARVDLWQQAAASLREHSFTTVALTPRAPSEDLEHFATRPRPDRLALILGHEGHGVSPEVEASADFRVSIQIRPEIDSLNLAVAAGIALYRLA
jgi:tRNA G18 (ribose-2'-O)-methylase SpoU